MVITVASKSYAVVDNLLTADEFAAVGRYLAEEPYRSAHAGGWDKVFSLADGAPLRGRLIVSRQLDNASTSNFIVWPTGQSVDLVLERIFEACSEWERWVGKQGADWTVLTGLPWVYPPGTALGWHRDRRGRSGAYAFYSHPIWQSSWGGETLIADEDQPVPESVNRPSRHTLFDSADIDESTSPAIGAYVLPRPNRLLLISAGTRHRVNPARAEAGAPPRCSVAGFFLGSNRAP
jgi:hypothetical protein